MINNNAKIVTAPPIHHRPEIFRFHKDLTGREVPSRAGRGNKAGFSWTLCTCAYRSVRLRISKNGETSFGIFAAGGIQIRHRALLPHQDGNRFFAYQVPAEELLLISQEHRLIPGHSPYW
jgi:hypothetical protein